MIRSAGSLGQFGPWEAVKRSLPLTISVFKIFHNTQFSDRSILKILFIGACVKMG